RGGARRAPQGLDPPGEPAPARRPGQVREARAVRLRRSHHGLTNAGDTSVATHDSGGCEPIGSQPPLLSVAQVVERRRLTVACTAAEVVETRTVLSPRRPPRPGRCAGPRPGR